MRCTELWTALEKPGEAPGKNVIRSTEFDENLS